MENTFKYIQENKDKFLEDLFEILRIPSISADSAFSGDVLKTADAVAKSLTDAGADNVEVYETAGYPIVYGDKIISADLPTVLVYGHYDVQPATPLELWDTDPFSPEIRKTELHPDGAIFARGACDDKGQMFMHVKAFEAMMASNELPCNVKFMIEGEEEVGSESLGTFVKNNVEKLKADVILVSDTGMISNDTPSICTGLRGISAVEIEVTGPNRDLHSGLYGGAVGNPLNILCDMISSLKDENNHITIPGFYDGVVEFTPEEREALNKAPFDIEAYKKSIDIGDVYGENGYTSLERASIRPALDLNGIWGGYQGEGSKTIIASKAYAKITMRLVSGQNPDKIGELFKKHFENIAPDSVKVKVEVGHGGFAYLTPTNCDEYIAASNAIETTFGKKPIPQPSGGSIPIISMFEDVLGIKSILLGFGLDSDAIHSPNEHYGVFNYFKGIETIPHFYKEYTALKTK